MKKFIIIAAIGFAAFITNAQNSVSLNILPNTFTNLLSVNAGGVKVTALTAARDAAGTATLRFIDNNTNSLTWTNQAYTRTFKYATNVVTTWTNYFGATNYMTNISLVTGSQSMPATNGLITPTVSLTAPASDTLVLNPVEYVFRRGIWVTNQGASNALVTITYQQY